MANNNEYYVLKGKAVPDVLLKVVEAKRLLETRKVDSIQKAADLVGISRSSFYKYKDDIFPFRDNAKGKVITILLQIEDEPGLLSELLQMVADYRANVLTINQDIPVNGVATLTLSLEILENTGDLAKLIEEMEKKIGVQTVKILARE